VTPQLEVRGLVRNYGEFRAVEALDFSVASGEVLGLVGPNGAGKTTTLRCLAGILPPSAGEVRIGGHDVQRAPVLAKRALAYLPDEPRLFEYLTVWEHLMFTARLYQVPGWEAEGRRLLETLELSGKESSLPGELSRGMKQKLSIACGFLHRPALVLLDEPLTGLDPLGIRRMKDALRQRAESGAALVLSSHLLPLVEELCHRVLILARGRQVAYGTVPEIRTQVGAAGGSLEDLFVAITAPPDAAGQR
jgi:ABC-2 type transport system ATP-binding protein